MAALSPDPPSMPGVSAMSKFIFFSFVYRTTVQRDLGKVWVITQRLAGRKTHITDKLLSVHVNKIAKSLSKGWTKLNYQFDNF